MDPSSSSPPSPRRESPYEPHQRLQLIAIRSHLDGRHVVFGEVIEGYEVVEKVENAKTGRNDKPDKTIKIAKSGELEMPEEGIRAEL